MAQQQPTQGYAVPQDNRTATVALVLGIVGLMMGVLVVAPFAWIYGRKARNEIDSLPGVYKNRSVATAGYWFGIIGTVLLVVVVVLWVVMGLIIGASLDELTTDY
ncbi:DUF4190 domain-containing protein [Kribbella sp. NBC_01245]|uniref:DUF4190 domain-containing protein n=1 Tax=Kribbella sp. NBC_01245 TaxID=2903578 RepID=UPI002E2BD0F1|nr:DUF4190 domain-containing protein [Kribbella sp. NBC_01245]